MSAARVALLATLLAACAAPGDAPRAADTGAVAADAAPARDCGVRADARLEGEGVGLLRVGAPVDELSAGCAVVRDTTVMGAEGMPERELRLALGADTVRAVIVDDRLWRVHVSHAALRTADSLGVGTTAAELRARAGARLLHGEGRAFVTLPTHCGLSFRLAGDAFRARTLADVPGETRVDEVLVAGCREG